MFRFALELEREFPRQVHCEVKLNTSTRLDFPEGDEKAQQVDIGISDLTGFAADYTAYDRFRRHHHLAFIEAKWFLKGWAGHQWEFVARDQVASVQQDVDKLQRHLRLGRCAVAAMLVVDDEDFFDQRANQLIRLTVWNASFADRRNLAVAACSLRQGLLRAWTSASREPQAGGGRVAPPFRPGASPRHFIGSYLISGK